MIKADLLLGYVVEFNNHNLALFCQEGRFHNLEDGTWECDYSDYLDDLTTDDPDYNIVKVYEDYTLKKVIWERSSTKQDKLRKIRCLLDEVIEEQN